jgi:hypothetical protein
MAKRERTAPGRIDRELGALPIRDVEDIHRERRPSLGL